MPYQTLNPTTGELLKTFPAAGESAIDAALTRAADAFAAHRTRPFEGRRELLLRVAGNLEARAGLYAELMAVEMGKPVAEGEAEVKKCATTCRYYAEHGERFMADIPHASDAGESFVRHEAMGPILAIMPWNFPFWQFIRFAAPALMAGNVVLLKHAPNTPQCALALEAMFSECGAAAGLVQSLFLTNEQAARVIRDRRVRGVTLTGSTAAGRAVASEGGRSLKKMVLELGGSDPFIVLPDADLDEAAKVGAAARCLNSGQSCIAAKRFLVHRSVRDVFLERFVGQMRGRVMGDPLRRETTIGPLARLDLREQLAAQVAESVKRGAKVLLGGIVPEGIGFFHPPTVLVDVPRTAPAWTEELFGPVASVTAFSDEEEAVAMANDTPYGLAASVWTRDMDRAKALIPRLETGGVFVNGLVKSDPRLPFGGTKDSGFGRELSREGMLEFVNQKTVWIR